MLPTFQIRRALGAAGLLALCAGAAIAAPARAAEAPPSHPFLFSLGKFGPPPQGQPPIPPPEQEFEDACGVAVDSFGDLYISDYYHHVIDIYSPELTYLTQIKDPDPDGPCNLAIDAEGHLYVNHWRRNVVRYTPSSFPPTASTQYGSEAVIDSARSTGVALDQATGNIYVDDRSYVAVYEPSGSPVEVGGEPLKIGSASLGSGYGVAISGFPATAGFVYVPDATTNTVKVYEPGKPEAPVQVIDGAGAPQRGFHSLLDSAVTVDNTTGHLYVADNLEPGFEHPRAVVDELNVAGNYRGQLQGSFIDAEPSALAVDAAGNVYATSGNTEEASLFGFGPTVAARSLAVTKTGTGEGTVTSEPAGINCGGACKAEYNAGLEVTLTATPAPGSAFTGWSGGGCSGSGLCHLTLAADTEVSTDFEALPPPPLGLVAGALSAAGSAATAGSTARLALARIAAGGPAPMLQATVPVPGTLTAAGAGLSPTVITVATGTTTLRLHLNPRGKRALRKAKRHRLRLKATVTFMPDDGSASSTATETVTFRGK